MVSKKCLWKKFDIRVSFSKSDWAGGSVWETGLFQENDRTRLPARVAGQCLSVRATGLVFWQEWLDLMEITWQVRGLETGEMGGEKTGASGSTTVTLASNRSLPCQRELIVEGKKKKKTVNAVSGKDWNITALKWQFYWVSYPIPNSLLIYFLNQLKFYSNL